MQQLDLFCPVLSQSLHSLYDHAMPQLCSAMQQAAKLEAEKAERYREFTLGKYAYGKGQYQSSMQLFTAALDREGPFSPMGGEVQLWLALAYQV